MIIALLLLALSALLALGIGVTARSGHVMGLEQWTVGGRGFGAVLVFLLLAGEIYTTFTFLGASGYAYGASARRPITSWPTVRSPTSSPTSCCRRSGPMPGGTN